MTWACKELKSLNLGDKRRNNRFRKIVDDILAVPSGSIPHIGPNWYHTKAMYTFFKQECVQDQDLLTPHFECVQLRAQKHESVLVVHDTTECIFKVDAEGLGYIDSIGTQGILSHNSMVLTMGGTPLGLIAQKNWTRPNENKGKAKSRYSKKIEDKESYRWIEGIELANARLSSVTNKVHICDRESDIFSLLSIPQPEGSHYIIRAAHTRKTTDGEYLWEEIAKQPVRAEFEVFVSKNKGKEKRLARMELRYGSYELRPPDPSKRKKPTVPLRPLRVNAIYAVEINPPSQKDRVKWKLLTDMPVETTEQALLCLELYSYRWRIENYFYVFKQGTILEKLQLRTASRLQLALATLSLVAFRIMWLTYFARETPDLLCDQELTDSEWKALCTMKNGSVPEKPPTIRQAVRMIASYGGFLGRKGDGEPGLKTIWRGMLRVSDFALAWDVFHKDININNSG